MALWVKHLQHKSKGQSSGLRTYIKVRQMGWSSLIRMQKVETEDPWGELARLAEIVSSKLST